MLVFWPCSHDGHCLFYGRVPIKYGRETIDILWSWLFPVFRCIWVAIHLPLPYSRADKPIFIKDNIDRSRIVVASFIMLAPVYLVLNAVSEFITPSNQKHTKFDKGGFLSNSLFLSRHGWHLSLFSEQRTPSNMQHIECLAVTPVLIKMSVGLSTRQA